MSNNVTVRVVVAGDGHGNDSNNGTATLLLYACDRRLMDARATLVSRADVTVVGSNNTVTTVILPVPDDLEELQQCGKAWSQMVEPSLYVSLDNSSTTATLTYADGPVFDISPGATVEMKLKHKQ